MASPLAGVSAAAGWATAAPAEEYASGAPGTHLGAFVGTLGAVGAAAFGPLAAFTPALGAPTAPAPAAF
eukprot:3656579-Prymnesium_polylepis.2